MISDTNIRVLENIGIMKKCLQISTMRLELNKKGKLWGSSALSLSKMVPLGLLIGLNTTETLLESDKILRGIDLYFYFFFSAKSNLFKTVVFSSSISIYSFFCSNSRYTVSTVSTWLKEKCLNLAKSKKKNEFWVWLPGCWFVG